MKVSVGPSQSSMAQFLVGATYLCHSIIGVFDDMNVLEKGRSLDKTRSQREGEGTRLAL